MIISLPHSQILGKVCKRGGTHKFKFNDYTSYSSGSGWKTGEHTRPLCERLTMCACSRMHQTPLENQKFAKSHCALAGLFLCTISFLANVKGVKCCHNMLDIFNSSEWVFLAKSLRSLYYGSLVQNQEGKPFGRILPLSFHFPRTSGTQKMAKGQLHGCSNMAEKVSAQGLQPS